MSQTAGENVEIERKFLVAGDSWRSEVVSQSDLCQGYLNEAQRISVRVRISGDDARLNIKSATRGISRMEFEYAIPLSDAKQMLEELALQPFIDKTRYLVEHEGMTWEVDEFRGANAGLVVAELELQHEDQQFARPDWLGKEVSDDIRYYNASLIENPYCNWKDG